MSYFLAKANFGEFELVAQLVAGSTSLGSSCLQVLFGLGSGWWLHSLCIDVGLGCAGFSACGYVV
ncbi:hypothetical protein AAHH88_00415 [Candidatus Hodgkinia cicadicola]